MKLSRQLPFLAAFAMLFFFASCSKTNKQGKMVPNNATMVVHINGQSLSNKLPWDEVKANPLFQEMHADTSVPSFVKNIFDNPENSGIDIKNDFIIFSLMDSTGSVSAFEGTIKDAAKFKAFNTEATKGGTESEQGGIHFISHSPVCVGWKDDKFVYVFNSPHFNYPGSKPNFGMQDMNGSRDVVKACKDIFELQEKNSLGSNERFTDLMKKEGDIHFWVNSEELNKRTAGMASGPLSMMKLDKLYEGSVTAGTVNFENGKISLDFKSYAGKLLNDLLKKYSGGSINEDMIKRIPSKDIAAVFALNFKPEGIQELLKTLGMDGLANLGLSSIGLTLDDFIKANKGDILIAVSDIKAKTDSIRFPQLNGRDTLMINHSSTPDFLFAASIGDKESFNKLIAAGKKIMEPKMGDSMGSVSMLPKVSYNLNADYFAIGNSKDNIDKYIAKGSSNSFDFLSKFSGNPFGGYINLQYIMRSMEMEWSKDSSAKIAFDASLKIWDNVYITGGKYNDGGVSYNMEVNMLDKSTNSLKQLNQYLGKLSYLEKERKKHESTVFNSEDILIDSVKVPKGEEK